MTTGRFHPRFFHGLCAGALALFALVLPPAARAQGKTYDATHTTTRVSAFTYDPATGLLKTETVEPYEADLCVVTRYEYDAYGNRKESQTANCAGASAAATFEPRSSTSDHETLAPAGGLTQPGGVVAGAFPITAANALGHVEYKAFDPRSGQVTALKGPNGLVTSWAYDGFGRKISETRADGSVTRTWYCHIKPDSSTHAGHAGNTSHGSAGNCDTVASGLWGSGTPGAVAHVDAVSYYVHTQGYLANGAVAGPYSRTYFDRRGREVRVVTQAFDGKAATANTATAGKLIVKDTVYHPNGAVAATTQPYFWDTKKSVVANDQAVEQGYGYTYTEYDVLGRPTAVYIADAAASNPADLVDMPSGRPASLPARKAAKASYQYEGLTTRIERTKTGPNASGATQTLTLADTQEKNPEGKVVRTTDALGAQQVFEYDAVCNLKRTFDPMGSSGGTSFADANVIAIDYDVRGRKTAISDPDKGRWTYAYNALGELVSQTDPRNQVTTIDYDRLGRVTLRSAPGHVVQSHYDTLPDGGKCATASASKGLLCATVTRPNTAPGLANAIERRLGHDALLRPTGETTLIYSGAASLERRYAGAVAYDSATGRVATQTYPSGLSVGFEYTSLGFVNRVGAGPAANFSAVYWTAGTVNAWGRTESSTLGNGVVQRNQYQPQTGRAHKASAFNGAAESVFAHRYEWDTLNNLTLRADAFGTGSSETADVFVYDALNRLTQYRVSAPGLGERAVSLTYNAIGNILTRSDVGYYVYGPSGGERPHAVHAVRGTLDADYSYDDAGNMRTASAGAYKSITYNGFNQPDGSAGILGRNNSRYTYAYDDRQQRIVERRTLAGGALRQTVKLHPDNAGGLGFEQEREGGGVINRHYISAGGAVVAMVQTSGEIYAAGQEAAGPPQVSARTVVRIEYWHRDHLGSIVALTDGSGAVRARYAYDPFGQRRNPDGSFASLAPGDYPNGTDRGFTGHEHLDEIGIVHMNGRLFDPLLARFLQADPLVQEPYLLQNYNAYSYVLNNPLNATDPDGRFFWVIVGAIVAARAMGIIDQKTFRGLMAVAVAAALGPGGPVQLLGAANPAANAAIAGFASGAVSTGNLKGAFQGAFSSTMFFGIGEWSGLGHGAGEAFGSSTHLARVGLHAVAGCIQSTTSGGSCKSGALGAAAGAAATPLMAGISDRFVNTVAHAVVGGTASVLGGGKFQNGAVSAAFGYLFNHLATHRGDPGDALSPESHPARGMAETAGDTAGLYVGGGLLLTTAAVGGAAVAANALFATETGTLVLWTNATGADAAGMGATMAKTAGGRILDAIQRRYGKDLPLAVWERASALLASNASGLVRVTIPAGGNVGAILRTELQVLQNNSRVTDLVVRVVRPPK